MMRFASLLTFLVALALVQHTRSADVEEIPFNAYGLCGDQVASRNGSIVVSVEKSGNPSFSFNHLCVTEGKLVVEKANTDKVHSLWIDVSTPKCGGHAQVLFSWESQNKDKAGCLRLLSHEAEVEGDSACVPRVFAFGGEQHPLSPSTHQCIQHLSLVKDPIFTHYDAANWMGQMGSRRNGSHDLGRLPLSQIALPGTHDSGTFNLTLNVIQPPDSFAGDIDKVCQILNAIGIAINCSDVNTVAEILSFPWSVTQTTDFYGQLERGGRSFDYRGYYDNVTRRWYAEHSLYGTNRTSPDQLAREIKNFLDEHLDEVVIVEYETYGVGSNPQEMIDIILEGVAPYGYHWTEGVIIPGNPSLSRMIEKNMRVILVAENFNVGAGPVPQGISNDYPDTCHYNQIKSYDENAIQITPDVECIVAGEAGIFFNLNALCEVLIQLDCNAYLLGYVNQINPKFNLQYVLNSYTAVTPLNEAQYFGNLWNFDNIDKRLGRIVASLNAITLWNTRSV